MKSHRGLSAIVGAVFLIAIVVGALSYITYSLETMANFSEQLVADESRQKNIQDEQFEITSVDVTSGNKLNAVIKNTGQIPLKITTLYIDEQGVNDIVNKTTIEKTIAPGTSFDFLTESIDIDIDPTKGYNLKMITSRGGSQSFSINSGSTEPLYMSLHILPSIVSTSYPSTLLFVVVNNMTSNNSLYNLTPVLFVDSSTGGATAIKVSGPVPTEYPVLKPGGIATFEYVYTVSGNEPQYTDFGVSLQNGYPLPSNPGYLQHLNGTITIKDVEVAIESGSAITSQGIGNALTDEPTVLYFHDRSNRVPVGWPTNTKQMDSSLTFLAGEDYNTNDGTILFISANVTQSHTLSAGIFNASLQYYSNATAPGVPDPSFAFFFECDNCPTADLAAESTGNLDLVKAEQKGYLKEKNNDVAYTKYGGPHNDGYFTFSGEDSWLKLETKTDGEATNTYSQVGNAPDTDAMWIRIPTATETYMPVTFFGENKDNKDRDRYEVYIGDYLGTNGFIFFNIYDKSADDNVTCRTNDNYDNGIWQFLTVVRTDDTPSSRDNCEIWINGTNPPGTNTPGSTSLTAGYTVIEDDGLLGDLYVKEVGLASIDEKALFTLNADIAMWMHWDDEDLEPSEIKELFYTNYGENGTRVHMQINHTNNDGSVIYSTLDVVDFEIPFYDPSANSTQSSSGDPINALFDNTDSDALWKYSRINVTGTTSSSSSFVEDDRLAISIRIDDDEQNLPINLWIDDSDYSETSLDDKNSFLQTPTMTPIWPTFSTITQGSETTLSIFNEGPEGIWFTFPGTRFIVSSIDGTNSYGAMPTANNAITIGVTTYDLDASQDGPFIADQVTASVTFNKLCDPIKIVPSSCTEIPPGTYRAFIFLSGFDEDGTSFIRTINLGQVEIII